MIALALFAVMTLEAQPSATVSTQPPPSADRVGEPPMVFKLRGVSAERTVDEFMNICVRPMWNADAVRAAAKNSDFLYEEEKDEGHAGSYRWKSPRGYVALEVSDPKLISQCALSIGSLQPRSGRQLLSMLKPAVEAELGHSVSEDDTHFRLEWTEPGSGDFDRIELARATASPSQAIWYVFDKTPPGVREKLDALLN